MPDAQQTDAPKDVMGFLNYYLVTKAPFQLPENVKEWIVQYSPWITIVILVLLLPPLLFVLGIGSFFIPLAGPGYASGFGLVMLGIVVQLALTILSLPGLFARKTSGWTMAFYARIVAAVTQILSGNVIGALIGALISLYVLFQIRPLYKS